MNRTCAKCGRRVEIGLACPDCRRRQIAATNATNRRAMRDHEDVGSAMNALPDYQRNVVIRWAATHVGFLTAATTPSVRARCTRYCISIGTWLYMVASQHSRCAICRAEHPPVKLVIDHDHQSGRVRGLLCGMCNTGLGQLGIDGVGSLDRAEAVVSYIKAHRSARKFSDVG